jgi:hypothetical protein
VRALSQVDINTLIRCAWLERKFDAGIYPATIGDHSHFRKLVRMGLLEFTGWGRDIDGERESDVPLHRMTPDGRSELLFRLGDYEVASWTREEY